MTLRTPAAIVAIVLMLSAVSVVAADTATSFAEDQYYILSLGPLAAEVDSIRTTAQTAGFSVIAYDGNIPQAFRAGLESPLDGANSVLSDERLLLVDGDRLFLRQIGEQFTFTVRRSETAYELVVDPHEDLPISDVLGTVLGILQPLGILGNEANVDIQAYAKDDLKGPAAPSDAAMESTLYGLRVARDWFAHAAAKQLELIGLRVEVVAEMVPDASLEATFEPYVVEDAIGLIKFSLPIDQLLPLARSAAVAYLRPPYRPSIP